MLEVERIMENKRKISKQNVHKAEMTRALQHATTYLGGKTSTEGSIKESAKERSNYIKEMED